MPRIHLWRGLAGTHRLLLACLGTLLAGFWCTPFAVRSAAAEPPAPWLVQFGTPDDDTAVAVAVTRSGDVIATGNTAGALDEAAPGNGDIWLARHRSDGERTWLLQLGGESWDRAAGLAVDESDLIVLAAESGRPPFDDAPDGAAAYLIALDADGAERWHTFLPQSHISSLVVQTDTIYVAGIQMAELAADPAPDRLTAEPRGAVVVAAVGADGDLRWQTVLAEGSANTTPVLGVTADGVVASWAVLPADEAGASSELLFAEITGDGEASGAFSLGLFAPGYRAVPTAHIANGNPLGSFLGTAWPADDSTRRIGWLADGMRLPGGSPNWSLIEVRTGATAETISGAAMHPSGRAWLTGTAADALAPAGEEGDAAEGLVPAGAWIGEIDRSGNWRWTAAFGAGGAADIAAPASAAGDAMVLAGSTAGELGGEHAGGRDVWIMMVPVDELGLPILPPAVQESVQEPAPADDEPAAGSLPGAILFVGSHDTEQDTIDILTAPHRIYAIQPDSSDLLEIPSAGVNPWKGAVASPGGALVAISSLGPDPVQILSSNGTLIAEVNHPGIRAHPTDWSADGSTILYVVAQANAARYEDLDIWALSYPALTWLQLTTDDDRDDRHAAWSPDADRVAIDADGRLVVLDVASGEEQEIVPPYMRDVDWSPDGEWLVYQAWTVNSDPEQWDLWIVAPDGSNARRITSDPGWYEENANWSPDSTQLVYNAVRSDEVEGLASLFVADVTTRETRLLYAGGNNIGPQWIAGSAAPGTGTSPVRQGSETLAFLYDDSLWIMQADGSGLTRRMGPEQYGPVHAFAWSSDGASMAVLAGEPARQLDIYQLAYSEGSSAGDANVLIADVPLGKLAWSGDRLVLMYDEAAEGDDLQQETKLVVYDLASASVRVRVITGDWLVGATEAWPDQYVAVSADGQWALFATAGGAGVARLDGWTQHRGFGTLRQYPQWAGPRTEVTFTWYDGEVMVPYYLDPTVNAPPVSFGVPANYVQVSPDGGELALAGADLRHAPLVDLFGGRTVTTNRAAYPRWSPSGAAILYRRTAYNPDIIGIGKPAPWWESSLGYYIVPAGGGPSTLVLPDDVTDLAWQPTRRAAAASGDGAVGAGETSGGGAEGSGAEGSGAGSRAGGEGGGIGRGTVTAGPLNLRREPSTDAAVMDQLGEGVELAILDVADGAWLRVRLADGTEGWVAAQYVTWAEN